MQMALGFDALQDIAWIRDRLKSRFGQRGSIVVRSPIGQLVKSLISGRTRDEVSLDAYRRLVVAYPDWSDVARAATEDIEVAIGDVTFADVKARHLGATLRVIADGRPDFDLAFLGAQSVADALAWLERLPGVGRKVSASTLNFSDVAPARVRRGHAYPKDFAPVRLRPKHCRHANRLRCDDGDTI